MALLLGAAAESSKQLMDQARTIWASAGAEGVLTVLLMLKAIFGSGLDTEAGGYNHSA